MATATTTDPILQQTLGADTPVSAQKKATTVQGEADEDWPTPVVAVKGVRPRTKAAPPPKRVRREAVVIERANLLNVSKLVIKELIDSSMSHGRMLDDDHVPLQQFFVVLEHVLRHGIKPKKGILRDRREFWAVLEHVERLAPDAVDITTSVREMPHIKTPLGRARAWLRLALMQKRLADYFRMLVDKRETVLMDFYEPGAFMLEEEAVVIAGLLVGLNVIDCNMAIKDEDLDQPMGVIDFSLYLREGNYQAQSPDDEETSQGNAKMAAILDQKNYLEELNRHLNATVTNLQQKLEALQTTNALMKEDMAISKNNVLELQAENCELSAHREQLLEAHRKQLQSTKDDIDTERETYQSSRTGLDSMYVETQKKLQEETHMRLDVEKELELQISMKQEMEMALRLLEKDIHEKQDSIVALRKQLDDIKAINLDLYNKLQESESSLKHKTELVTKLEDKTNQMANTIKELEAKIKQGQVEKQAAEETARKLGQQLADKDAKRSALETDLKIEREWRGTLQRSLDQEKQKVAGMHTELQHLCEVRKEYDVLQGRHLTLNKTCEEQEAALSELGSHLSESKLKFEDMKEAQMVMKEAAWADDKEIANCRQCTKVFSVSRRKHHCRNCGDIFCNECSDNKMPLPSSAKPVRVCDGCHTFLLQRYSANN